jgi:uncharacterized Zn finger protein
MEKVPKTVIFRVRCNNCGKHEFEIFRRQEDLAQYIFRCVNCGWSVEARILVMFQCEFDRFIVDKVYKYF